MVVYALLVVPFKTFSAYAGGVALGLMMIPLVMRTTEEVLVLVPQSYREAGLALGIARWKIVTVIVVKTALKGIVTGILIALARVAGETAPSCSPLWAIVFGATAWASRSRPSRCKFSSMPFPPTTTGIAKPGREPWF